MASFTLAAGGHPFPAGTTVEAYRDRGQQASGAPIGALADSAVVAADSSLTFTALAAGIGYYAVALVSGVWRWVRFSTDPAGGAGGGDATEATLAAILAIQQSLLPELQQKIETGDTVLANIIDGALVTTVGDPEDGAGASAPFKGADLNATAGADTTVVAAVTAKKIRVTGIMAVASGAGEFLFKDGSTARGRFPASAAGDGFSFAGTLNGPFFTTAYGAAFVVTCPAGVTLKGKVTYVEIP